MTYPRDARKETFQEILQPGVKELIVRDLIANYPYGQTMAEVGSRCLPTEAGQSAPSMKKYFSILERMGVIERVPFDEDDPRATDGRIAGLYTVTRDGAEQYADYCAETMADLAGVLEAIKTNLGVAREVPNLNDA